MDEFVPRRRTWEDDLKNDAGKVEVAKSFTPEVQDFFRTEKPEEDGYDKGENEMADAVGEPSNDIKNGMCPSSENIRDIGTVEDVFECRKQSNRNSWSPRLRNKSR